MADTIINEMDSGTLDLTDESYDDYAISTIYEGMAYYTIKRTGANGFEANKLQLNEATAYTYTVNKDIRYNIQDEVDIWTFFKDSDGTITMQSAM